MMTGDQYRESLHDGRATYFEGKKIEDLAQDDPDAQHTAGLTEDDVES